MPPTQQRVGTSPLQIILNIASLLGENVKKMSAQRSLTRNLNAGGMTGPQVGGGMVGGMDPMMGMLMAGGGMENPGSLMLMQSMQRNQNRPDKMLKILAKNPDLAGELFG